MQTQQLMRARTSSSTMGSLGALSGQDVRLYQMDGRQITLKKMDFQSHVTIFKKMQHEAAVFSSSKCYLNLLLEATTFEINDTHGTFYSFNCHQEPVTLLEISPSSLQPLFK